LKNQEQDTKKMILAFQGPNLKQLVCYILHSSDTC